MIHINVEQIFAINTIQLAYQPMKKLTDIFAMVIGPYYRSCGIMFLGINTINIIVDSEPAHINTILSPFTLSNKKWSKF